MNYLFLVFLIFELLSNICFPTYVHREKPQMSPVLIVLENNVNRRQNIKQSLNLILITNKHILHIYYRHLGFLNCVLWISTKCEQVLSKTRNVDRKGNIFAVHCGKSIIKSNKDHVEENLKRQKTWQEVSDNNNHRLQDGDMAHK